MGYNTIYPTQVIEAHRAFIGRRRNWRTCPTRSCDHRARRTARRRIGRHRADLIADTYGLIRILTRGPLICGMWLQWWCVTYFQWPVFWLVLVGAMNPLN
ncbi:hypothetical protein ACIGZJ_32140 [Kitasatospora sp. NPDC052868]|uniref:hypothetical protein n=1 Tax=Kitasatospora sp. NPDC052868 TaxID=3364060 RepID=UPI0037C59366